MCEACPSAVLLLLSAGLPVACWVYWNLQNFGDAAASAAKIQALGWTRKPIRTWWHHPIFAPRGFLYFWSNLMASFWRGEFIWGMKRLAFPIVDAFYWISSAVLAVAAAISLLPRFAFANAKQRPVLILAFCSFFCSVGYLGLLSIVFDFGDCPYPSRGSPFFISGRLLLGALIPFLMVYLHGLDWMTKRLELQEMRWWLLGGIAVLMMGSQTALDHVVFRSTYNWFHMGSVNSLAR